MINSLCQSCLLWNEEEDQGLMETGAEVQSLSGELRKRNKLKE